MKSATVKLWKACTRLIATGPRGMSPASTHSMMSSYLTTLPFRFVDETTQSVLLELSLTLAIFTDWIHAEAEDGSSFCVVLPLPKFLPVMRSRVLTAARKHGAVCGRYSRVAVTPSLHPSAASHTCRTPCMHWS